MATGTGSHFSGGIKHLEPVGKNDEIIMNYSIHDAIETGFNKIVFIFRTKCLTLVKKIREVKSKFFRLTPIGKFTFSLHG